MPTIHGLVDSGAWGEVRKKLKSKGRDHLFSSTAVRVLASLVAEGTNYLTNPFLIACSKKDVPQDVIRAMLAIDNKNLTATAWFKGTPLHVACELGSVATVKTLLMVASDNVRPGPMECAQAEDVRGTTALRTTWSRHFYPDESSYLGRSMGITDTSSEFLHKLERIKSPTDLEGHIKDSWDKTILLLKALTTDTVDDIFPNGGQWNVLHSIARAATLNVTVPRIVLWHAAKLFPELARWRDGDGNFPLHIVASAPVGNFTVIEASDEGELDDQAKLICKQIAEDPRRMLLNVYPDAAKITNNQGRLPLHIALHHGSSGETAAVFLKAAPKSVNSRDPVTMLFPFMLAACDLEDEDVSRKDDDTVLDATYVLLRENPANVQGGIRLTEYEKYLSHKVSEQKQRIAELECQLRKRKRGDN